MKEYKTKQQKRKFYDSGEWILKYHVPDYKIHFKRNEKCKCNVWPVMWSINSHDAFFILYRRRTNVFGYIIVCGNKGEFIQKQYRLSFFHSYYVLILVLYTNKNECNKKRDE
ncbi:hypothetical protein CON82_30575 [Bacillus wiedmannii]|nr:hypothetical protein CON82_30575 [Bacillus wiedmannii]